MAEGIGLMAVKTAAELDQEDLVKAQERAEMESDETQAEGLVVGIAGHVLSRWQAAKDAKTEITERLLKCLRRRNGVYDPEKLHAIRSEGGSEIYMMLTEEKCAAAESWIQDVLAQAKYALPTIEPTPVPELPSRGAVPRELISLIAKREAEYTEKKLQDFMVECKWKDALNEVTMDLCTYPAAILKGPVTRMQQELAWGQDGQPEVVDRPVKTYETVSPFDAYPAPSATGVNDGYFIERHSLTRESLEDLIGVDGYDESTIRTVLATHATGQLLTTLVEDSERKAAQGQGALGTHVDPDGKIDALQFWGAVPGRLLLDWGLDEDGIEPARQYECEVWLVDRWVIKAELNPDPLGRRPYHKACYRERNGQFWGVALPEIIQDSQDACNAAARNLVDNMAISSGPQVGVDISKIPPDEELTSVLPWKIWQVDMRGDPGGREPVWFFAPPNHADVLLRVYEFFSQEADNKSGIPKYSYGQQGGGVALSTATGFSLMMDNALRTIKLVVGNFNRGIIAPSVRHAFDHMMIFDPEVRDVHAGDIRIRTKGTEDIIHRERRQMLRMELLRMLLNAPDVAALVGGAPGIAGLIADIVEGMNIGSEDITMILKQAAMQQLQSMLQGGGGGPPQMAGGALPGDIQAGGGPPVGGSIHGMPNQPAAFDAVMSRGPMGVPGAYTSVQ